MTSLPRFKDQASCVKCDFPPAQIKLTYLPVTDYTTQIESTLVTFGKKVKDDPSEERMEHVCPRCGFRWITLCMDVRS